MREPFVLTTLHGNQIQARLRRDHDDRIDGVGIDFLNEDGRVQDMEYLDRLSAIRLSMALADMAVAELSTEEQVALYREAIAAAMGPEEVPINILAFPSKTRRARR